MKKHEMDEIRDAARNLPDPFARWLRMLMEEVDLLTEAFHAADDYIGWTPCDPDIFEGQLAAYEQYMELRDMLDDRNLLIEEE